MCGTSILSGQTTSNYSITTSEGAYRKPSLVRNSIQNGDTLFRLVQISNMLFAVLRGLCRPAGRAWPAASLE